MPDDPTYTNPFNEIRNVEAMMMRRRGIQAQASRFTPISASLYANYANDYPWMQPGVIRAASMAGYYPNNPDMVRVAATSLAEGMATGRLSQGQRQRVSYQNPGHRDPMLEAGDYLTRPSRNNGVTENPLAEYVAAGMIDEEGRLVRPDEADFDGTSEQKNLHHQFTHLLRLVADQQEGNKAIPYMSRGTWREFDPKTGNTREIVDKEGRANRVDFSAIAPSGVPQRAGSIPLLGEATRAVQNVVEPAYQAIQPVARTAGMIANAPIQEIQTTGREIYSAVRDLQTEGFSSLPGNLTDLVKTNLSETDAGIAAEQLLGGDPVDTGSGFFVSPQSQVARERVRRESEHGQIGGHNITWGRWIASAVTDPNTVPFDVMSGFVDFSIQLADPSAIGLGKVGQAKQAAKLFQADHVNDAYVAAGIFGSRGRIPFVDVQTASKVFDSPKGMRALDDLAATPSAYQIGKKMSQNKMDFAHDPELYDKLATASTTQEVRAILTDAIDTGYIREVADVTKSWGHGIASHVRPHMPRSRIFDKMPGIGLHLTDPKQVANEMARSFRNVNAPEEALEEAFNKLAKARTKTGRRNAMIDIFGKGPNSILAHHGVDPEVADQMMRLYKDTFNEMWRGLVDEIGNEVPTWEHVDASGNKTLIGGPHAMIEMIEDWMPMPDPRVLREFTNKFPNLFAKLPEESAVRQLSELPGAALDYFVQEVWKPLALMRGAWYIRVLGEGQLRIAAEGLSSLFSGHPLEALGFMLHRGRFGITERVAKTMLDEDWKEVGQYNNALSTVHNWAHRPGAMEDITTKTTLYRKGRHHDAEYRHAWARQLMKFNYDTVYHRWLNSNSLDEMMDWFTKGEGRGELRIGQEAYPGNLQTPEQVRKYLDEIDLRFEYLANGNSELFDILKNGEWTDDAGEVHSIYRSGTRSRGNPEVNPAFTKLLSKYIDDGPEKVVGRDMVARRGKSDYPQLRKHAVQNLLYASMSKMENFLARGPVVRQAYIREVADMIQFGSVKGREQLIKKAIKYNAPNRVVKRMRYLSGITKPGKLNLAEMDLVAKGRAMEKSQKLLYSYAERRQVFDIFRNFFPFGDAWYEVLSTWGKIIRDTAGKPLRRGQQAIEGSINSGFFHENRFGELTFTYPFSMAIAESLTGAPVEVDGRVQGLSMFGEIMPGLGPVAQIPAAWFLKDKPDLAALEEFLLPFGGPELSEVTNWKTYAPGWMKTALSLAGVKTMEDKRMYENTVSQLIDYYASTGEFGYTAAEQSRLVQKAKDTANKVYALRALGQFILPAAPQPNFYVEDPSGTRLSAVALAEEFHNEDGEDFDTAVRNFVDKYGENALGALVSSSATSIPGIPDSKEGQAWVNDNGDLKGKYPLVYALFAPTGEFDIGVYQRQFASGDRTALSAEQHASMISDWLNRYWRTEAMRRMGVVSYTEMDQAQRSAWEDISALIDEQYPSAVVGRPERPEIDDMITQLEQAGTDEKILDTAAGPALAEYLALRRDADAAVDILVERGAIDSQTKGYTKSKQTRPIREALRSEAQRLIEQYPAFQPLWDHIFSRELIKE